MKIIFVGPFGLAPKGTMSVRALPLAKSLVKRGHAVTMLLPPWDDVARSNKTWVDDGVTIVNIRLPPRLPFLFEASATYYLVKYVISRKPDVVHFFKPKAYSGLAHLSLWWMRRIKHLAYPLVVDTDDCELAWNQVLPYKWHYKKLFAWQEDWGLRSADAVTAASRALEELTIQKRKGEQARVYYLPNGCRKISNPSDNDLVELSEIRARWQVDDSPIVLLYSRFLEFRLERIVEQVRIVATRLPRARWLIVGRGLYNEDRRLAEQISDAGLNHYVRFTGWVLSDQLDAYFSMADVAIFPYDDNMVNRTKCSVKLIDLLVRGVPVVADAVGQNCEYITNGVSGRLVEPEDSIAMASVVVELLSNPEDARAMGLRARSSMIANYNWDDLSKIAEGAYTEAVNTMEDS